MSDDGKPTDGDDGTTDSDVEEPLIDLYEAARRLSVTPRFLRELVQRRELNHYLMGRRLRFDPADLKAYRAGCWRPARRPSPGAKPGGAKPGDAKPGDAR